MSGFYVLKDAGTLEGIDGLLVAQEQHDIPNGAPLLDGELARSREPFDTAGKKWLDGALVDMTDVEQMVYQVYVEAQEKVAEAASQSAKSAKLKAAENKFFDLCFVIFGDHTRRGFDELNAAIEVMTTTEQNTATALAIRLLAVDAECKREGGNQWWDAAAYHEEIV